MLFRSGLLNFKYPNKSKFEQKIICSKPVQNLLIACWFQISKKFFGNPKNLFFEFSTFQHFVFNSVPTGKFSNWASKKSVFMRSFGFSTVSSGSNVITSILSYYHTIILSIARGARKQSFFQQTGFWQLRLHYEKLGFNDAFNSQGSVGTGVPDCPPETILLKRNL